MGRAFNLNDVYAIEGDESDELEQALAIQRAINSGMWSLQGSYGRTMMAAIESGRCMLGPNRARDYWGNFIPARNDVAEHTKGHRTFVVDAMGEQWASEMEAA